MTFRRLLAGASAILAALAILACGGDDDGDGSQPTPSATAANDSAEDEAYFQELSSALEVIGEDSQSLNELRAGAFDPDLSEEERITNAEDFAAQYREFAEGAREDLLGITPGPSLSGQHGALVDSLQALADLAERIAEEIEESPVATEPAFLDLFFQLDGQTRELRVRDACFDLQTVANGLGIETEITCPR